MEDILDLMSKYMEKHDVEICIRFYKDGSGAATTEHFEKCENPYFYFKSIEDLKKKLKE